MTIFSLNSSIHDGITKVKGSLEAALRGAKYLADAGIDVDIKTPLIKDNQTEFYSLKKFCDNNDYSYMASSLIFQKTDGSNDPLRLTIEGSDLNRIVNDIDEVNNYSSSEISEEYMCNLLKYSFFINSIGDVFPCNGFYKKWEVVLQRIYTIYGIRRNSMNCEI